MIFPGVEIIGRIIKLRIVNIGFELYYALAANFDDRCICFAKRKEQRLSWTAEYGTRAYILNRAFTSLIWIHLVGHEAHVVVGSLPLNACCSMDLQHRLFWIFSIRRKEILELQKNIINQPRCRWATFDRSATSSLCFVINPALVALNPKKCTVCRVTSISVQQTAVQLLNFVVVGHAQHRLKYLLWRNPTMRARNQPVDIQGIDRIIVTYAGNYTKFVGSARKSVEPRIGLESKRAVRMRLFVRSRTTVRLRSGGRSRQKHYNNKRCASQPPKGPDQ
jgi:hypothetical protein